MVSYDFDAHEWDVWTLINGGLVRVKGRDVSTENAEVGLPVMARNDRDEFIRSEVRGWWFRCNWAGRPLREGDTNWAAMPGVLKLRVQLDEQVAYTVVCAAILVWNMPNLGVPYRKIIDVYEWPDGTRKIGDEWHHPRVA